MGTFIVREITLKNPPSRTFINIYLHILYMLARLLRAIFGGGGSRIAQWRLCFLWWDFSEVSESTKIFDVLADFAFENVAWTFLKTWKSTSFFGVKNFGFCVAEGDSRAGGPSNGEAIWKQRSCFTLPDELIKWRSHLETAKLFHVPRRVNKMAKPCGNSERSKAFGAPSSAELLLVPFQKQPENTGLPYFFLVGAPDFFWEK